MGCEPADETLPQLDNAREPVSCRPGLPHLPSCPPQACS